MPAPANANELLDLVQKSGVVEEAKLRAYVKKLTESGGIPKDAAKLAGLFVRDAVLTYFQAEQLLQGKYKRFTIGKYKVLEKLGSGGMGQVFLCEHKLMRRRVAVKVLPTAKADDPSSLERFYREARAVAAVDHPNIVRAYDIDQDENLHFLVMEYVDGTNLQDLVKKFGPLDITRACHYIYGAAIGLQHAHEIGLVHRDIKPGNILVDRAGVVKILDMGLARFFNDEDDILTKKYDENVLGTADYLAPEQALESHTVDIRADIYSLGATFYYLLTASPLFPEGSVAQKLIWHQNRSPRPIKSLRPEVPDDVVAVIDRMMMKDPAKRYQTPAEVMAALAHWVVTPIPPPADKEMPILSPAAGGTGRAPAAAPGAGSSARPAGSGSGAGRPDAPTVIAPITGTKTAPATSPAITPAPAVTSLSDSTTPGPGVWESLDSDAETLALGDTDRAPGRTPRPARPTANPKARRRLLYAGLALLLVGGGVGAYFAFLDTPEPTPDPGGGTPGAAGRRIVVSKTRGDNTVETLRDALTRAGPGDTIVIAEPKLAEPNLTLHRTRHKDLTIESGLPDGKPAVIEATGTLASMIDAGSVEGFRLRNVEFDGRGTADVGIQLSGPAPGTVIEGVTVRNVKTVAVKMLNAAGEPGRPILLDRCRVVIAGPTQTGVLLFASNADTRRPTIRNSRIEGVGTGTGIKIDGALTDGEFTGNRFYNLDAAVLFAKPPTEKVMKGQIAGNTFYQTKAGLALDLTPPAKGELPAGKFDLVVNQNYFAKTPAIGSGRGGNGPVPGVRSADNAHAPDCGGGNLGLPLAVLPTPLLPTPDVNNDATFLRFPAGKEPTVGPNKVRVGAQ
jgi:tRNA A-37 threonylcarbamoyl transferase component Bud32